MFSGLLNPFEHCSRDCCMRSLQSSRIFKLLWFFYYLEVINTRILGIDHRCRAYTGCSERSFTNFKLFLKELRWPSGKVSILRHGELQARNPIPLKLRGVWGLLHAKSYVVAKRPPVGVVRKFGEEAPAQVSSSSSDCFSK
ncbi:hypothetical protein AVEN_74542-1 [Araneus ventricosus]|uniref:Uncharacterized protein n=1 Tax=Araneus ventricosus TaxID=182803 RepID=A0A4Y2GR11_ARAVE|nr:hypothetical protein AVEN_74542-1 [Araneus ventricosus]